MGRETRYGTYDFFFADNANAVDRWPGENGGFTDNSYTHNGHGDSCSSLVKLFPISSSSSSPLVSPSQPQASTSQSGYIQHPVSKFDTLAGIAIRYGVEVADIKRLNGLVTDIQMFALKSVSIPPGRHPPSVCLSNGLEASGESSSERTPPRHQDPLDSFQSLRLKSSSSSQEKISPAMNSLRGYYRLRSNNNSQEELPQSDFAEMAAHRNQEDGPFLRTSPSYMNPPLSLHRKSRSVANNFEEMEMTEAESETWSEKLVRRRQKSETDFSKSTEKKKKKLEENGLVAGGSGGGGGFSPITSKGLAQRSKQVSLGGVGGNSSGQNLISLGDSVVVGDGGIGSGVRKSMSTPSLQDQETGTVRFATTLKRSSKPDLLVPPSAGTARPILPKPGWKSKTALD